MEPDHAPFTAPDPTKQFLVYCILLRKYHYILYLSRPNLKKITKKLINPLFIKVYGVFGNSLIFVLSFTYNIMCNLSVIITI